jgi:hypothetical protein
MIDRRAAFQKLMLVKARHHATLHPASSSSSGVHMTSALHIVCPVGLQWVSGRSALRRKGDLKEQVP